MPAPNCFIVYVSDVQASARFYGALFGLEPAFTSPRYIAFRIEGGVVFSLWSGSGTRIDPATPRTGEVCLNLPGGAAAIDALFAQWSTLGATTVKAPYDDVFGRTFLVADPDGNLLRVAPVD